MSSQRVTRSVTGANISPTKRRDQREQAEAQALEEVAHRMRERQRKSAQLRKLRLAKEVNCDATSGQSASSSNT